MTAISTNLKWPAIISILLVLPFMILEWVNRREFDEGFPIQLFIIMWLLALAFSLILMPVVRKAHAGNKLMEKPWLLFIQVVFLIFIAWLWVGIVRDQIDCFLGVPLCD